MKNQPTFNGFPARFQTSGAFHPLAISDQQDRRERADLAGSICEDEDNSPEPFAHVSDRETEY